MNDSDESLREANLSIPKYMPILGSLSIGSVLNVLLNTLSVVADKYGRERGNSKLEQEWLGKAGLGMYTQVMYEKLSEEQPPRRQKTFGARNNPDNKEKALHHAIEEELLAFVSTLPYDVAFIFLAELTVEWIRTCSEKAIRQESVFVTEGMDKRVHDDKDLSKILLDWIIQSIRY